MVIIFNNMEIKIKHFSRFRPIWEGTSAEITKFSFLLYVHIYVFSVICSYSQSSWAKWTCKWWSPAE